MQNIVARRSLLSLAVTSALGIGSGLAEAGPILRLKIEDVGRTVGGVYDPTLDGNSGGFKFASINPATYAGVSLWTGDAGTGRMLWEGAPNPTGSFSTGFLFSSAPFVPYTFGNNAVGEISINTATGEPELIVTRLDFGGNYGGAENFDLPPDPGTLKVNWLIPNGDGTYKVSFQWSHDITTADDPSLIFTNFTARWILEGTITTADGGLPRVEVDIDVPGGATQECSVTDGSFVSLVADVQLFNGAELAAVSWVIDGESAGTGESIEPFLTLGSHSISVTAESTTGQLSTARTNVAVRDTTAPDLDLAFIDARSGEPVSSIDQRNVHNVITRLQASDICDPDPVTEGTGGFDVADGGVLKIQSNKNAVTLTTNSLILRATATDASHNSASQEQTLTITD